MNRAKHRLMWEQVIHIPEITYMFQDDHKESPFWWYRRKGLSGFQCSLGWKRLVVDVLRNLASKDEDQRYRVDQVKEKFGRLRMYIHIKDYNSENPKDIELWEICNEITCAAEITSGKICEVCGTEFTAKIRRPADWIRCECLFHHLWNKYVNNYRTRIKIDRVKAWCKNHLRL